jgi:short-subunit dehydrogenase
MNVDTEDTIALITGASRGIGKRRMSTLCFQGHIINMASVVGFEGYKTSPRTLQANRVSQA